MTLCVSGINIDHCAHARAIGTCECLAIVIAIFNDPYDGIVVPDPSTETISLGSCVINFFTNY